MGRKRQEESYRIVYNIESSRKDLLVSSFETLKQKVEILSKDPTVNIISIGRILERPLTNIQQKVIGDTLLLKRWNED
jgi:hypothetical protein